MSEEKQSTEYLHADKVIAIMVLDNTQTEG